jgi:hypothetical protein
MQCPACGAQNSEDSNFCKSCGMALAKTGKHDGLIPSVASQPAAEHVRTSGLAVTSLVLGVIGLIFSFLGILAIILGAIAISQINREPDLEGRGLAIAGLVLGIIDIAVWLLVIIFASSLFFLFS